MFCLILSFDIRLMKEGRMKGQAFISLPSERRAKRALREVHGYILHGKPMVIVSFSVESVEQILDVKFFAFFLALALRCILERQS